MTKHTPGPWGRSERPDGNWWHIGAGNQAIAAVHAASKTRNKPYASMFEANANLIAAAPDLLAAQEAVMTAHKFNVASMSPTEVHALCYTAVAKAKGETV